MHVRELWAFLGIDMEDVKNVSESVTSSVSGLGYITDEEFRERQQLRDRIATKKKKEAADRNFLSCGIGSRFVPCRLDNYTPRGSGQAKAIGCVLKFASTGMMKGDGLFLAGDPGGGKTHLLVGCLWIAAHKEMSVKYTTLKKFFLACRSAMDGSGKTESEILKEFSSPRVLVLDDFHRFKSDPGQYQYDMLWMLLDERYANERSTLTSSNLSKKEVESLFDARSWRRLAAKDVFVPVTEWGK